MTPAHRATAIVLCLTPWALIAGAWAWWAMTATLVGVRVVSGRG